MFNFFNKKMPCPIDEKTRIWMEDAMIWLMNQFSEQKLREMRTIVPTSEFFPIALDQSEKTAFQVLKIVAEQMEIDYRSITLEFFNEGLIEIQGELGKTLQTQLFENETISTGLYFGKDSEDKFIIAVSRKQFKETDRLVATIAHELAHIKILGEDRLKGNDEFLTDLVTVFFGLGIFTSNSSGKFTNKLTGWEYSQQGYLSQQEWGYALALYTYIKRENEPIWTAYLSSNIKSDYDKSVQYILQNTDKVLV